MIINISYLLCEIEEMKWMSVLTHTQEQDTRRLGTHHVEERIEKVEK